MLMDTLKSDMGSDVMFESFARVFLIKLVQKYGLQREDDITFNRSFTSKHYKRVLDYVAAHFGGEISLEAMAAEAGLSPSHFSRLFKQTIGISLHRFVMHYRVERAKEMLKDSGQPKIDIALSCGFADQAHFTRVFKQIEGVTPKRYHQKLTV